MLSKSIYNLCILRLFDLQILDLLFSVQNCLQVIANIYFYCEVLNIFSYLLHSFCEDNLNTTLANLVPSVSIPVAVLTTPSPATVEIVPCTCGVFLSGQFVKGSADPPRGNAALLHELMVPLPCTPMGLKQCTNKCLDAVSIILKTLLCCSV